MDGQSGKGDSPRKINKSKYDKGYDKIFGKKNKPPKWKGNKRVYNLTGMTYNPRHSGTKRVYSDSLGVNPDQIPEAMAAARRHGVAAEFTKDGCAIITSEKMRRDLARTCGMYTGSKGFGTINEDGSSGFTGREGVLKRREVSRKIREEAGRYKFDEGA